jgi:hypothetical protein
MLVVRLLWHYVIEVLGILEREAASVDPEVSLEQVSWTLKHPLETPQ